MKQLEISFIFPVWSVLSTYFISSTLLNAPVDFHCQELETPLVELGDLQLEMQWVELLDLLLETPLASRTRRFTSRNTMSGTLEFTTWHPLVELGDLQLETPSVEFGDLHLETPSAELWDSQI